MWSTHLTLLYAQLSPTRLKEASPKENGCGSPREDPPFEDYGNPKVTVPQGLWSREGLVEQPTVIRGHP